MVSHQPTVKSSSKLIFLQISRVVLAILAAVAFSANAGWQKCQAQDPVCANLIRHLEQPDIQQLYIRDQKPVSDRYDVVILYDSGERDEFGVFVIERSSGRHYLTIDVLPSHRGHDYAYEFQSVSNDSLVIVGYGTTYEDSQTKRKYYFDLENKQVSPGIAFEDVSIDRILIGEEQMYLSGSIDFKRGIIVHHRARTNPPSFEIATTDIAPIRESRWEQGVATFVGRKFIYSYQDGIRHVVPNERKGSGNGEKLGFAKLRFRVPRSVVEENMITALGPGGAVYRFLAWNDNVSPNSSGGPKQSGIFVSKEGAVSFYELPQPKYELFEQHRPRRVAHGYEKDTTTFANKVGPIALVGRKILFGIQYYDGEGYTGVGGFGYFDIDNHAYELHYIPEIASWSVSAMHVEGNNLWMGLTGNPEGASYGGGLVRYNLNSGKMVRFDVPGVVNVIRRWRGRLYLGTSIGLAVIDAGIVHAGTFGVNEKGKYRIEMHSRAEKGTVN